MAVGGDQVSATGIGTANGVRRRAVADGDAVQDVTQVDGPGDVSADAIAQDHVSRRAGVGQEHAVAGVAGDEVAPADRVGRRAAADPYAGEVADPGSAVDV